MHVLHCVSSYVLLFAGASCQRVCVLGPEGVEGLRVGGQERQKACHLCVTDTL